MPMPGGYSVEAPTFTGYNVTSFLRNYNRMCKRYCTPDSRACELLEEYCTDDIGGEIRLLIARAGGDFASLQESMRTKYQSVDNERDLTNEVALEQFVILARQEPYDDLRKYSRHFLSLMHSILDAGNPMEDTRCVRLYLRGLPERYMEQVVRRLKIDASCMSQVRL